MSLTEMENIEASLEVENDESHFERVDSEDPWGTPGPGLEVISVTLKLRSEVRTGNRDWRAIPVQAGAVAMAENDQPGMLGSEKRLEAEPCNIHGTG